MVVHLRRRRKSKESHGDDNNKNNNNSNINISIPIHRLERDGIRKEKVARYTVVYSDMRVFDTPRQDPREFHFGVGGNAGGRCVDCEGWKHRTWEH